MKGKLLPVLFYFITLIFLVLSIILLPDRVITQFSFGSPGASTMKKPIAILIPTVLSLFGSSTLLVRNLEKIPKAKGIFITVVGYVIYLIMLFVNC